MSDIINHFKAHNIGAVISVAESLDPPILAKSTSFWRCFRHLHERRYTMQFAGVRISILWITGATTVPLDLIYTAATHQRMSKSDGFQGNMIYNAQQISSNSTQVTQPWNKQPLLSRVALHSFLLWERMGLLKADSALPTPIQSLLLQFKFPTVTSVIACCVKRSRQDESGENLVQLTGH